MGGSDMNAKKTKNKDFLKWTRAESCFRKDNIISTDWHERLERLPLFVPSYAKCRPEMVYIMSMEYGRLWQKEKDDWFAQIFKAQPKEQDMKNRRRKLRREFLEAKRQAEIKIRERKERLAKEAEAKAKAEAEAQEKAKKIKAKLEKCSVKKKEKKEKKKQTVPEPEPDKKNEPCPKGWTEVELTVQCECAANRAKNEQTAKQQPNVEEKEQQMELAKACSPDCMPNQIAEAVERAEQKESTNECEANKPVQTNDGEQTPDE